MVSDEHMTTGQDEILLLARFDPFKRFLLGTVIIWQGFLLFSGFVNAISERANPIAVFLGMGVVLSLFAALATFLSKHVLFYHDRVVMVWHFLGRRTIYFANARVSRHPGAFGCFQGYSFRELGKGGKPHLMKMLFQMPVACSFLLKSESKRRIDAIVAYLTEGSGNYPRICTKSTLPREVVFPTQT